MATDKRTWSANEKLEIVIEGLKKSRNVKAVCDKYSISRDTYYTWKNQLCNSACTSWEEQSVGRKGPYSFSTKSEAEQAYKERSQELEEAQETIESLHKQLEGATIQRDFAEFRLSLSEPAQKKTAKPKKNNGS